MQGFRTIVVALVGAVLAPWLAKHLGLQLDAEEQTQLAAAIMALLMTGMRVVTSTPAFQSVPKPVILTVENILEHIDIQALIQKIREHQVAKERSVK